MPVFKAHGLTQATLSDCISETFSAIRTVSLLNDLADNYLFGYGFDSNYCVILPFRLVFYFCVSCSSGLHTQLVIEILPYCIQVRSFGGEKRQMLMFGRQVSNTI